MLVYVALQLVMVVRDVESFRVCALAEHQVQNMPRGFTANRHRFDAGHTVYDDLLRRHLGRTLFLMQCHFRQRNFSVKVISTANGFSARKLAFNHLNLHLMQQVPHRGMHLRLLPKGAGIMHRHC